MKTSTPLPAHRGMTLIEILVALSIFGIVMAGLIPFYINTRGVMLYTANRFGLNSEFRNLSQRMATEARTASQYVLYTSFTARTTTDVKVGGQTGDFLWQIQGSV